MAEQLPTTCEFPECLDSPGVCPGINRSFAEGVGVIASSL